MNTTKVIVPNVDQIVKGNVIIKKLSKYRYRITFSKIGKFLIYQVWNKDNANNMNDKRGVGYASAKQWVKYVNIFNKNLEDNGKPLFTPTTVMETKDFYNYAFVIHKIYLNSYGKVVFTVSTKEISLEKNNTSKKMIHLPQGKINNVRFDIDDWWGDFTNFFSGTVPNFFTNTLPTVLSYSTTVESVPGGKPRNKQGMGIPGVCWEDSQLSGNQPFAFEEKFYIGLNYLNQVDLSESNRVYYDSGGYFAYICSKLVD